MSRKEPGSGRYLPYEYERYATEFAGQLEEISWMWWDSASLVTATATALTFFTGAPPATLDLGNMLLDSVLPAPDAFLLENIRVCVKAFPEATTVVGTANTQTGSANDMAQILYTCAATLTIGQKTYGQWPLWALPAGGGPVSNMQTGDVDVIVDQATNGVADGRAPYALATPLLIMPQINFNVVIDLAAALTLVNTYVITVTMDGRLLRPVQ